MKLKKIFIEFLPLFLVWFLFSILIFLVSPFGNYPVNDDWDFLLHVKYFSEGNFVKNSLIDASFILQGLIALPWIKFFGLSFTSLRILTIIFTFILLSGLFLLLRNLNIKGFPLYLLLISVLVDPFFVFSSFSFMTEIYFLVFVIFSLYFYFKEKNPYVALFLAFLSCFIRQFGYILILTFLIQFYIEKRSRKFQILSISLLITALIINLSFPAYTLHDKPTITKFISLFGNFLDFFTKISYLPKYLTYLAFTISPLVLATKYNLKFKKYIFGLLIPISILIFSVDIFDLKNVFHLECYLCETDFKATKSLINNVPFKFLLSLYLSYVILKLFALIFDYFKKESYKEILKSKISIFLNFSLLSIGAILISDSFYDRYFLVITLMLVVSFTYIFKSHIVFSKLSIASFIFNFILILFLNIDFHNSMNTKWNLGLELMKKTSLTSQIYVNGNFNKYFYTLNKSPEELRSPIKLGSQSCFVLRELVPSNNLYKNFIESKYFNNSKITNPTFSNFKSPNNLPTLKDNLSNIVFTQEYSSPIYNLIGYKSYFVAFCTQENIQKYNLPTINFSSDIIKIMDEIHKDYSENYSIDVLTGVRPTGNLTIANYLGAIKPLIELQESGYSTVIFVADMHGLTDYEPKIVAQNIREIIADYLALGINPKKIKIYVQSSIASELLELTMLLLRHITVAELLRVPALKDKLKSNQTPENANVLLAIYPVLMASDILIQKSKFIPVGQDQISHLEVTRLLGRRFNSKYGNTLPIPVSQIIKPIKILALRGEGKMSKSDPDNAIFLTDSPEDITKKIKSAETANPGEMTLSLESHFNLASQLCVSDEEKDKLSQLQTDHGLGKKIMSEFKPFLSQLVINFITEFQNRRRSILSNPDLINSIIKEGNEFAKNNALKTLNEVRDALYK